MGKQGLQRGIGGNANHLKERDTLCSDALVAGQIHMIIDPAYVEYRLQKICQTSTYQELRSPSWCLNVAVFWLRSDTCATVQLDVRRHAVCS